MAKKEKKKKKEIIFHIRILALKMLKKITDFFDVLSDVSLDASCFAFYVL